MIDYKERIRKIQRKLDKLKVGGVLITNRENIYYLCNFTGDAGILYITANKAALITDYRFEGEIVENIKGSSFILTRKSYFEELSKLKFFSNKKNIGFESHAVSYGAFQQIRKVLKKVLKPVNSIVEESRTTKDEYEIKNIKKAASIAGNALKDTLKFIKIGAMEKDIALELEYRMRKYGSEGISFETIVASGYRAAIPHGTAGTKRIKENEFIIIDFGAIYKGYHSDITRTFFIGKPKSKDKEIFDIVYSAQKRTRDLIKPEMELKEIDKIARDYITEKGYGEKFTHSLGHGVGLLVHEAPLISTKSTGKLKEGMVITVEPGVYIKNYGGVRIEDMITFIDGKKITLTSFPRELQLF